ncbi:MAG: SIS domain-containing protein [Treponema sp.]|jgi:D-arabinose 5-phosphate isomerase GutQ|nr:SIS domain-containing protein [Treponema sp.]
MKEESWKQAREAFGIEAGALARMADFIGKASFAQAVNALAMAPRIGASGCGHTGIACRHFAHLMCCIERPARFISPAEAVHGASGFLQKGDAMLLASRGGKTAELLPVIGICKQKGVTLIALTENAVSPLARDADIFLPFRVTREVDKYNNQGTTSFIVMCAFFDALQTALIEETDYQNEQFAVIHPGGAVGEKFAAKGKGRI